jgi:hypothetical protein
MSMFYFATTQIEIDFVAKLILYKSELKIKLFIFGYIIKKWIWTINFIIKVMFRFKSYTF